MIPIARVSTSYINVLYKLMALGIPRITNERKKYILMSSKVKFGPGDNWFTTKMGCFSNNQFDI